MEALSSQYNCIFNFEYRINFVENLLHNKVWNIAEMLKVPKEKNTGPACRIDFRPTIETIKPFFKRCSILVGIFFHVLSKNS